MYAVIIAVMTVMLISGSAEAKENPRVELARDMEHLIVVQLMLRDRCDDGDKNACRQKDAIVDVVDALLVRKIVPLKSATKLYKQWILSHRQEMKIATKAATKREP
jgi:hypothetical protein